MTQEQIKNEYAVSKGFINWEDLVYMTIVELSSELACDEIIEHQNAVTDLIQKEYAVKISKNVKIDSKVIDGVIYYRVNESSILNTPIL